MHHRIIRAPLIEDIEAMQGIAHGAIDTAASCWFLASDLGGVFGGNIVWVHIIGTPDVEGSPIIHMEDRELHSYP